VGGSIIRQVTKSCIKLQLAAGSHSTFPPFPSTCRLSSTGRQASTCVNTNHMHRHDRKQVLKTHKTQAHAVPCVRCMHLWAQQHWEADLLAVRGPLHLAIHLEREGGQGLRPTWHALRGQVPVSDTSPLLRAPPFSCVCRAQPHWA